jgi:hypothetical protein
LDFENQPAVISIVLSAFTMEKRKTGAEILNSSTFALFSVSRGGSERSLTQIDDDELRPHSP